MTIEKLSPTDLLNVEDPHFYYYDTHPTHEDLMPEGVPQFELIVYLVSLLRWQFRLQGWYVYSNLGIYQEPEKNEYPLAPDVVLFKNVTLTQKELEGLKSWKMLLPNRPAPALVIEICSEKTWREDLRVKPDKYQEMGVKEYFAYDPYEPRLWKEPKDGSRLQGWRFTGQVSEKLVPNDQGWLWSAELECWLGADVGYLRLYNNNGQQLLTKDQEAVLETEVERRAKEAAWAKLRELGIDPEKL